MTLWEKMASASKEKNPPDWLSTHPPHEARVADLKEYMTRVLPLYQEALLRLAATKPADKPAPVRKTTAPRATK